MRKPKQTVIQALVSQEIRCQILAAPGIRPVDLCTLVSATLSCSMSYTYRILRNLEADGHVMRKGRARSLKLKWADEPTINATSIDDRVIRQVSAASVRINMPRYPSPMAWVAGEIGRAA